MGSIGGLHGQRSIPATWMRSGTSKGLFIFRDELPKLQSNWEPILLALMGAGDQIDGIGGGTPTTSKVAVISRSTKPGFDVDYTFAQVDFATAKLDMTGTCGNLAAGIGRFALDQGLAERLPGRERMDVKIFGTNTGQSVLVTIAASPSAETDDVKVTFIAPNGNMAGRLFPSGSRIDHLSLDCPITGTQLMAESTLIDCTNPFILVNSASLPESYSKDGPEEKKQLQAIIEAIRRAGSVRMGLARDLADAAQRRGTPKIATVGPLCNRIHPDASIPLADVRVTAFSGGILHPSFQGTGAICLAAALSIPGTIASNLLPSSTHSLEVPQIGSQQPRTWRIAHRAGQIHVDIAVSRDEEGEYFIHSGSILRTARKLFEGLAFY
ncbi:PrpF domain-containing protein [Trichoderma austrokoningii]